MTISSTTNRAAFTGNGVTTSFSFPYSVLLAADLKVYVDGVLKTLTTDYTLSGTAPYASGTNVQFLTAPASSASIVLLRDPPITQAVDLVENDSLPVEDSVEKPLDKLTMICQRLAERITRALRLSDTDVSGASTELPTPAASKLLGWDSAGTALQNYASSSISATIIPSAFMQTMLDDADAKTARQTLLIDKHGADIASSATLNLDNATGDVVDVTGTTTITAVTLAEGVEKVVRFTGALTLTHGASLVLPGAANIPTGVGDFAIFRGYASSVVRCVAYVQAANSPVFNAFSASRGGSNQGGTVAGAFTLCQFGAKDFDTLSNYDNVTTFRHTPTIPGKYYYSLKVTLVALTDGKFIGAGLFKNSSGVQQNLQQAAATQSAEAQVSTIIDMNGTTDFMEGYIYNGDTAAQTMNGNAASSRIMGFRIGS